MCYGKASNVPNQQLLSAEEIPKATILTIANNQCQSLNIVQFDHFMLNLESLHPTHPKCDLDIYAVWDLIY